MSDHGSLSSRGSVGESPLILGYAGLLPQVAATATCGFGGAGDLGPMFAFGYATLILSFLGGIWWGFAMHAATGQGRIATWSVLPSLFGATLILLTIAHILSLAWALVLLGSAVIITLLIDRRLVDRHIAPAGWMALRIPLSVGLGTLTILCGIACGGMR
ncbi:MAG: DUF3429 domain-containing protein [Sphingomonas sp.]